MEEYLDNYCFSPKVTFLKALMHTQQRINRNSVQIDTYNETANQPFFSRGFRDSADAGKGVL